MLSLDTHNSRGFFSIGSQRVNDPVVRARTCRDLSAMRGHLLTPNSSTNT